MTSLIPDWTLWYDDETVFTSLDGEPNDSPRWGVVCVTQPGKAKDVLWNEWAYIYHEDMEIWTQHDLVGFIDQQVHFSPMITCVRIGRDMLTGRFKEIVERATKEARGL